LKRLLARIKGHAASPADETSFFSSSSQDSPEQKSQCSWATRAAQLDVQPVDRRQGTDLFVQLWRSDRHVVTLDANDLLRISQYLEFVQVPADREVIGQDEVGSYMLIVLDGSVAVDRGPAWGGKVRLAEARAGDMLGEMSLLDGGMRFSSCRTLTPCMLAVMDACRLDEMIHKEPRLGVALLASLSRRLSLRLRQVSTRLSAVLSQQ
jgi:CRP-like cAMP-binding protein